MTSTETTVTTDPRVLFARAHATGADVIAGLAPEDLERPTPCTEFDVRALVGHLLAVTWRVRDVGRGGSPFDAPEIVEGVADDGWAGAWATAGAEVAEAWTDDAALERIVELPWATLPGGAALVMWVNELSVHTWDLATATQRSPRWDDEVLAAAYAAMQMGLPAEGRVEAFEAVRRNMPAGQEDFTHPFAAAVEVPDDAPLIDRLVAWNGRTPR